MGRIWYEKNRELVLKQAREYYLAHAKEMKEQNRAWRLGHPGYSTENGRKWRHNNPVRSLELYKRHIAKRKRGLPTSIILGESFPSSVLHHVSPNLAIYIPEDMHKAVQHNIWTGKGMTEINGLAWSFYQPKGEILPIRC
jgi:hypothetical protein